MTVSAQSPVISYTANGSATEFAFPFLIIQASDLKVYFNNIEVTTGFSVSGEGVESGGSVTFLVAPAATTTVKLLRSMTLNRSTDYVEGGPLRAAVLDADLDRLVMMQQDTRADSASLVEFAALLDETRENIDNIEANAAAAEAAAIAAALSASNAAATLSSTVKRTSPTGSTIATVGTTAERDAVPEYGWERTNSTLNQKEWFNGIDWVAMGGGATGAPGNHVFHLNHQEVTADYSIPTGQNAVTAGPISIASGVTVTIPSGSTWSIV